MQHLSWVVKGVIRRFVLEAYKSPVKGSGCWQLASAVVVGAVYHMSPFLEEERQDSPARHPHRDLQCFFAWWCLVLSCLETMLHSVTKPLRSWAFSLCKPHPWLLQSIRLWTLLVCSAQACGLMGAQECSDVFKLVCSWALWHLLKVCVTPSMRWCSNKVIFWGYI